VFVTYPQLVQNISASPPFSPSLSVFVELCFRFLMVHDDILCALTYPSYLLTLLNVSLDIRLGFAAGLLRLSPLGFPP
jgi:hypothetical protein